MPNIYRITAKQIRQSQLFSLICWFKNLISCCTWIKYIMGLFFFRLNSHVVRFLERRKKNSSTLRNGAANNAELDDGCDATAVLLKKGWSVSKGIQQLNVRLNLYSFNSSNLVLFIEKVCFMMQSYLIIWNHFSAAIISDTHCLIIITLIPDDNIIAFQLRVLEISAETKYINN